MKNLFHFAVACFACAFSLSAQDEPISYSYDQSQTSSQAVEVSKDASGQGFSVVLHTKALPSMGSPEEIFAELNKLISQKTVVPLEQRYPGVHFKVKDEDLEYDKPYLDQSEDGKIRVLRVKTECVFGDTVRSKNTKEGPPVKNAGNTWADCIYKWKKVGDGIELSASDFKSESRVYDNAINSWVKEWVRETYDIYKNDGESVIPYLEVNGKELPKDNKERLIGFVEEVAREAVKKHEEQHVSDLDAHFKEGVCLTYTKVDNLIQNMKKEIGVRSPNSETNDSKNALTALDEKAKELKELAHKFRIVLEARAQIVELEKHCSTWEPIFAEHLASAKMIPFYIYNDNEQKKPIWYKNAADKNAAEMYYYVKDDQTHQFLEKSEVYLRCRKIHSPLVKIDSKENLIIELNPEDKISFKSGQEVTYWEAYESLIKNRKKADKELKENELLGKISKEYKDEMINLGKIFLNRVPANDFNYSTRTNTFTLTTPIRQVFIDELNKAYTGPGEPTSEEAMNYFRSANPILEKISVTDGNRAAAQEKLKECLEKNRIKITSFYGSLFDNKISDDDISKVVKGAKGKEPSDDVFESVRLMRQFAMLFNNLMIGMYPDKEERLKKRKEICGMK